MPIYVRIASHKEFLCSKFVVLNQWTAGMVWIDEIAGYTIEVKRDIRYNYSQGFVSVSDKDEGTVVTVTYTRYPEETEYVISYFSEEKLNEFIYELGCIQYA